MLKTTAFTALLLSAGTAFAAPEAYTLDPSHSQIIFEYNHLGFSNTTGMFGGIEGEISFDADAPADSTVSVSFPITSMMTGFAGRDEHFLSPEIFGAEGVDKTVTFKSTSIEMTGEKTALITGDLTLNGVTKEVVLDAVMNQSGTHPMMNKPWLGFDATTTLLRSDFNVGMFAPAVSDEVTVAISIEAGKAE